MRKELTRTTTVRPSQTKALEPLEHRRLLAFSALIDFQPPGVPTQAGYKADTGATFGDRGNGLTYGWNAANNNGIDRNGKKSPNQAYDTFNQTQKNGNFSWEIALPNGTYDVRPVAGDATSTDAFYHFLAEGQPIISGRPSTSQLWIGGNKPINVTDGRLTITNGPSAVNNKIAFIEVRKAAPTRPSGLAASAVSSSSIQLTWTDNAINEDGFIVERSLNGYTFQPVATVGANVTTFTDSGLAPDTRYTYQVKAFNDVGQSQASNVASATSLSNPALVPAAPSNLAVASATNYVATLTWTDNSNNEDKFLIQVPAYTGAGWTTYKEIPANSTSTTVYLHSATINQFRVVARNSAGGSSNPSNTVSIATKPEAPIYPGAQAVSSTAIDIFWDSLDSGQFHVEKLIDGQWVRLASDLANLTYRDTGLTPGTTYFYRIIAVGTNEAGDSDPTEVVSATTAPAAVTGLSVTNTTSSSVSLQWNDVTGEAGYSIERSLDDINWTTVTFLYPDSTTYTATGLASGQTYFFRVTGFAYGPIMGDRSDPVSATTR
jgi:hypothetical protein